MYLGLISLAHENQISSHRHTAENFSKEINFLLTVTDRCEDHECFVQSPVDEVYGENEEEVIAHELENI
jgi:hypothetical protein